jgi:hypothetical protein
MFTHSQLEPHKHCWPKMMDFRAICLYDADHGTRRLICRLRLIGNGIYILGTYFWTNPEEIIGGGIYVSPPEQRLVKQLIIYLTSYLCKELTLDVCVHVCVRTCDLTPPKLERIKTPK